MEKFEIPNEYENLMDLPLQIREIIYDDLVDITKQIPDIEWSDPEEFEGEAVENKKVARFLCEKIPMAYLVTEDKDCFIFIGVVGKNGTTIIRYVVLKTALDDVDTIIEDKDDT